MHCDASGMCVVKREPQESVETKTDETTLVDDQPWS
jgi:hypothetical protein